MPFGFCKIPERRFLYLILRNSLLSIQAIKVLKTFDKNFAGEINQQVIFSGCNTPAIYRHSLCCFPALLIFGAQIAVLRREEIEGRLRAKRLPFSAGDALLLL